MSPRGLGSCVEQNFDTGGASLTVVARRVSRTGSRPRTQRGRTFVPNGPPKETRRCVHRHTALHGVESADPGAVVRGTSSLRTNARYANLRRCACGARTARRQRARERVSRAAPNRRRQGDLAHGAQGNGGRLTGVAGRLPGAAPGRLATGCTHPCLALAKATAHGGGTRRRRLRVRW